MLRSIGQPDIDGLLIGGASLSEKSFSEIIHETNKHILTYNEKNDDIFVFTTISLFMLLCVVLCFVVLIQESKSTASGASFGGDVNDLFLVPLPLMFWKNSQLGWLLFSLQPVYYCRYGLMPWAEREPIRNHSQWKGWQNEMWQLINSSLQYFYEHLPSFLGGSQVNEIDQCLRKRINALTELLIGSWSLLPLILSMNIISRNLRVPCCVQKKISLIKNFLPDPLLRLISLSRMLRSRWLRWKAK